MKQCLWIS